MPTHPQLSYDAFVALAAADPAVVGLVLGAIIAMLLHLVHIARGSHKTV